MNKLPTGRASRDSIHLIALIAILATAILLIVLGHITAGSLTTVCGALATLFGAWSRFGPVCHRRHPPSAESSPEEERDVNP